MRLVSYTRSTSCLAGQTPSAKGITEQNERIRAYANVHGWQIMKMYNDRKIDPCANSGFEQLLEDGVCRSFDAVIVDSVFRAGCDFPTGRQVLLQTFHYAGIAFIVVEDDFISIGKTNTEAEAYFERKAAEKESVTIRTSRANRYDSDKLSKTDITYGYIYSDDQQAILDSQTAPIVNRIFSLYDKGCSKNEIAQILTKEGIPIPEASKRYVGDERISQWNNRQIQYILSQEMYSGYWTKDVYGTLIECHCTPIVSKEIFSRVQIRLKTQKDSPQTPHHPYVGIIEEEGAPDCTIYLRKAPKREEWFFSYVVGFSEPRLSLSEVESMLRERLNTEKERASKLLSCIKTKGEKAKEFMKESLQQELKAAADQITDHERKKMEAYRRFQAGELPQDEWEANYTEAQAFVIGMEPIFQSYQDRVQDIEMAINERNPWIQSRLEWDDAATFDRNTLRRFVQKIVIKKMQIIQIVLTQEEWFAKLPLEWRKQYGA